MTGYKAYIRNLEKAPIRNSIIFKQNEIPKKATKSKKESTVRSDFNPGGMLLLFAIAVLLWAFS